MREWETAALKSGDLYPLLRLGQRPWIREGGRRVSRRVGTMGTRCFKLTVGGQRGGCLSVIVWQATDIPALLHPSPAFRSMSFFSDVLLSSAARRGRNTEQEAPVHAHTYMHAYMSAHMLAQTAWLCFFPLAYLVEWPWKTKQVLSTFDFSAFKLILSAQLLKQLSSPAVSNFRLGTFTGCQVLRLHCESLTLFLSKRYSNNLYFF